MCCVSGPKRSVVRMFPGKKNSSNLSETLSQDSKLCFGNKTNITKIYVLSNTHILHNLLSTILIKTFQLYWYWSIGKCISSSFVLYGMQYMVFMLLKSLCICTLHLSFRINIFIEKCNGYKATVGSSVDPAIGRCGCSNPSYDRPKS